MRRMAYILVVVGLIVTACIVVVSLRPAGARKMQLAALEQQRLERALAELQGQIHQLQSQKNSVEQQARQLEEAVATLAEKRKEDQLVRPRTRRHRHSGTKKRTGSTTSRPSSRC